MESNAVTLHKSSWRPQPTLPYFGLQYSFSKKSRTTVSLSSMQGSSPSLRFVSRHGRTLRRAGWVAPKWMISHLPPTFGTIIRIPRPLRPCIWRPRVPVPHVPPSHTWCPQVPRLASLSPKSPHTRPDVPVPLSPSTPSHFYTRPLNYIVVSAYTKSLP